MLRTQVCKRMKKVSLSKMLKLWGVLLIVGVAVSVAGLDFLVTSKEFERRSESLRVNYIDHQQAMIRQEVDRVISMISYAKSKSEVITRRKIKNRVEEAYAIAENIYQQNKNSKTKADIQVMVVDALRTIRFAGGTGYFFIIGLDGTSVLFADRPSDEGRNLLHIKDTKGQYVVKDLVHLVRTAGEGFYGYSWTKPGTKGHDFKKISFVKMFTPLDCFIGTGLYVDDVEAEIKSELLETIGQIRFGPNMDGYIFVVSYDGVTLMNSPQRHLIGKNAWDVTDCNGVKIVQEERRAVENPEGDFIYYRWNKPSSMTPSPKTSFIKGVPSWQWMVGAGVYLDDVDIDIALLQAELHEHNRRLMLYLLGIVIIIIAVALSGLRGLSKRLNRDIELLGSFFKRAAASNEPMDRAQVALWELDQIAGDANRMLMDKIQIERELKLFKVFAENSSEGMGWSGVDGKCVYLNQALADLAGESDRNTCLGCNVAESYYPASEQKRIHEDVFPIVLQEGTWSGELLIKRKNGELISTRNSMSLIRDEDGDPLYFTNIITDISKLKEAEQEKERLGLQLLQAKKMESIGLMAGGVAHDLNNILSGIVGYPELLLLKLPEESDLREPLEAIQDSGERAAAVVADLLTVARGVASVRMPENINVLVAEYMESPECFALQQSHSKVVFRTELDAAEPVVACSAVHVKKCIMNLVANGAEANKGPGFVTVSSTNLLLDQLAARTLKLAAGNYVVVGVEDSGSGISSRDIEHIFEPFYSKKVMGKSGTGLELAVVWNTMEDHGGLVLVESSSSGTRFELYFPVVDDDARVKGVEARQSHQKTRDQHILIIDDEPQLRDLATRMLESLGYTVDSVPSGERGLEFVRENPVDLVILDMVMDPGMSGRQTYEAILKKYPDQKALVVSGFSESDDVKETLRLGAWGFIEKPYSLTDLGNGVRDVLAD